MKLLNRIKSFFQQKKVENTVEDLATYKNILNPMICILFNEWHRLGKFNVYKNAYAMYDSEVAEYDGQFFSVFAELAGGTIAFLVPKGLWEHYRIPAMNVDYTNSKPITEKDIIRILNAEAEYPFRRDDKLTQIEGVNFSSRFYVKVQKILNK